MLLHPLKKASIFLSPKAEQMILTNHLMWPKFTNLKLLHNPLEELAWYPRNPINQSHKIHQLVMLTVIKSNSTPTVEPPVLKQVAATAESWSTRSKPSTMSTLEFLPSLPQPKARIVDALTKKDSRCIILTITAKILLLIPPSTSIPASNTMEMIGLTNHLITILWDRRTLMLQCTAATDRIKSEEAKMSIAQWTFTAQIIRHLEERRNQTPIEKSFSNKEKNFETKNKINKWEREREMVSLRIYH